MGFQRFFLFLLTPIVYQALRCQTKSKIWYLLSWCYYGPACLDQNRTIRWHPQDVVCQLRWLFNAPSTPAAINVPTVASSSYLKVVLFTPFIKHLLTDLKGIQINCSNMLLWGDFISFISVFHVAFSHWLSFECLSVNQNHQLQFAMLSCESTLIDLEGFLNESF